MALVLGKVIVKSEINHFPEEIYQHIANFLLPKNLQNIKYVKMFNKVLQDLPRFKKKDAHSTTITYSSATFSQQFIKFNYKNGSKVQSVYQIYKKENFGWEDYTNLLEEEYENYLKQDYTNLNKLLKDIVIHGKKN
jgi:hypothetical protein